MGKVKEKRQGKEKLSLGKFILIKKSELSVLKLNRTIKAVTIGTHQNLKSSFVSN